MKRAQREALSRLLAAARDAELGNDAETLRPLLIPRRRRGRGIPPREDQLPMPL